MICKKFSLTHYIVMLFFSDAPATETANSAAQVELSQHKV